MASSKPLPSILRTIRSSSSSSSSSTSIPIPRPILLQPRSRSYADSPSKPWPNASSSSPTSINQIMNTLLGNKAAPQKSTIGPLSRSANPAPLVTPLRIPPPPDRKSAIPNFIFSTPSPGTRATLPSPRSTASPSASQYTDHVPGGTLVDPQKQLYHLHVFSTKHNTHIAFTDPSNNAIVSASTGRIGFKKAGRHTYDAAYQLAAYVFQKIEEKGVVPKMVEVVFRGFNVGREAMTKALMGKEGKYIKSVVVRITDGTRTKFGGTRSKKRRRI